MKSLGTIQEALVLGLMFVSLFAIFYFDFDFIYKVGIVVLAFTIILLTTVASALINQQKEIAKSQA